MMEYNIGGGVILAVVVLITVLVSVPVSDGTYCAFLDRNRPHEAYETVAKPGMDTSGLDSVLYQVQAGKGQILADNMTIKCLGGKQYCYSLWRMDLQDPKDANSSVMNMIMQGCWDHADPDECGDQTCVSNRSETKFCCCKGDMCNVNVTDSYVTPPIGYDVMRTRVLPPIDYIADSSYRMHAIIAALGSVTALALFISITFLLYRVYCNRPKDGKFSDDQGGQHSLEIPRYPLEDLSMDECLQRGRYGDIWRGQLKDKDVAIKLLTASQRQHFYNERDIYLAPLIDHDRLLKFYGSQEREFEGQMQYLLVLEYVPLGALCGYLKNNTLDWVTLCKMCCSTASALAHLHSSDIMKGDLQKPVIAHRDVTARNILVRQDLTCCLCDLGFALKLKGTRFDSPDDREEPNLTDVGTLRYMSPEVLDGAVNLRDCESSLKQIDVYALGLVIWEIASRCSDLYQGLPVPEYQSPYSAELGQHPTLEDMQLFVSKHKLRPNFPDVWKDSNQAIRSLKETIDECWDQDAEARLTAMCVEERFVEMAQLWEVKYRSMLPLTHHRMPGLSDRNILQRNQTSDLSSSVESEPLVDKNQNLRVSPSEDSSTSAPGGYLGYHRLVPNTRLSLASYDERSTDTVVTLVSPSASEPDGLKLLNRKLVQPKFHGRNPIVERNTHKRSDEELTVQGNAIVDANRPYITTGKITSIFCDSPPQTEDTTSALVENDELNRIVQHNPPIPYLQNRVCDESPVVRAKRENIPLNGIGGRRGKRSALGHIRVALSDFLGLKKHKEPVIEASLNLVTSVPPSQETRENLEKCNLNNPRALETAVTIVNGAPVIGAAENTDNWLGVAEVGVAKLQSNAPRKAVMRISHSSGELSPSENRSLLSQNRPSSLSLNDSIKPALKGGEKIKRRIKTPYDARIGRFSLYDDRMMDPTECDSRNDQSHPTRSSISLHQFNHVANNSTNNC